MDNFFSGGPTFRARKSTCTPDRARKKKKEKKKKEAHSKPKCTSNQNTTKDIALCYYLNSTYSFHF